MSNANPLQPARYLLSVHNPHQLPKDAEIEVAVVGRSNAGKSSALNAICAQNKLARTSKTPGRTQQLVYFELMPGRYLVDLPGYGYAEVPGALRDHWRGLIDGFLRTRQTLRALMIVMDIRHPLKPFDLLMLEYAQSRGLAVQVLLTKADKLPRGQQAKALQAVRRDLPDSVGLQLFSASSKLGVEEARAVLASWLALLPSDHAAG
ncbi:ribosome biogenesis GTP-binding protein YihA/YsxC [Pseudomarimonas arenosa]|uniref:Probable GTP-binding protein EngB n=1 Tax=Pseudomarimonas arenosa TaxID=2774145 RepID=A0AAW3ZKV3_9GAMM|nr:ribosome biogenesis GTP-binding protein YihA/YsxC [Pseudomarimonas arenosa]MBD8525692.1 YihA family ribosome biogenesis GTP-binding protein [Pseudomarimonas arenosa]